VTYATRLKAERNVAARRRAIAIAGAASLYGSTDARANDMPRVWRADCPGSASSEGNGPRLPLRRVHALTVDASRPPVRAADVPMARTSMLDISGTRRSGTVAYRLTGGEWQRDPRDPAGRRCAGRGGAA
jgi:hypothetical protein